MNTPKISIVIPVYNVENYLPKCLDSIINQTFQDIEIICVDNNSTDNSLNILKEYKNKDTRFLILQEFQKGAGAARNLGLKSAQGKYVQFLDADDYFEPQMLEKLYNLAENNNAQIAVCSSRKVDDLGNITETQNPISPLNLNKLVLEKSFNYNEYPEDIFDLIGTIPWNKLYLRDMLITNNLKFPMLTGPDDWCFVQMANVCAQNIVAINEELINYRYNRPGSVQTYRANHAIDIVKAGLFLKKFLEEQNLYNILEKAYIKTLTNAIRWETSLCNKEQFDKFLQEFKQLMPNDWKIFDAALSATFITPEYLTQFIGDKKVYLWGASIFIKNILEQIPHNSNILGIIDRNKASWGKDFCGYKIFSPEILNNNDTNVLITVYRNHETVYPELKEELWQTYPQVEVLPNIFSKDNPMQQYFDKLLEQLKRNKSKKIIFWGASVFLKEFLEEYNLDEYNILGIIDKNEKKWGQKLGKYEVFSPEILNKEHNVSIYLTIKNNNIYAYAELYHYLYKNYPQVKLEENYFKDAEKLLKKWYFSHHQEELDLENPKSFNEKIQWTKLYELNPLKATLSDKYLVRDWIKQTIGEEYLIPLLGVWDNFDEIDFDKLPNQFVLKCNHGCGYNIIVPDKSTFDKKEAQNKINAWMQKNFAYHNGYELQYISIDRKIIAEQYLSEIKNSLFDYRFFCCSGKVKQIWLDVFSGTPEHQRLIYNENWEELDIHVKWPRYEKEIEKPKHLNKMIELAEKMSKDFAQVRVDFYYVNNKIYFGEMTFTSMSGGEKFDPKSADLELGQHIHLPPKNQWS